MQKSSDTIGNRSRDLPVGHNLNVTNTTFQTHGQKTNNPQKNTVVMCQISLPHWNPCDVKRELSLEDAYCGLNLLMTPVQKSKRVVI
jgi:hypothetical protein